MKRVFILFIFLIGLLSCNDDILKYNKDIKSPEEVEGSTLFSYAQKSLVDQMVNTNVNLNVMRLFSQYWTETTYTEESRYEVHNRKIPENNFDRFYRRVLKNLKQADINIRQEPEDASNPNFEKQRANQLAVIDFVAVYTWHVLVDMFDNVPYSQALDLSETKTPQYDDAFDIYKDLIDRINKSLESIDAGIKPALGDKFESFDIIYGGKIENWVMFANSLKFKLAMRLSNRKDVGDIDLVTRSLMESKDNLFKSNLDNASLKYLKATPNTNPLWLELVQSSRNDFITANTIVDIMNDLDDPRRPFYFGKNLYEKQSETDSTLIYKGAPYGYKLDGGENGSVGDYSSIGDILKEPDFEGTILDYVEIKFLQAEAIERGFDIGGNAQTHYNDAITASIQYWGGTDDEAVKYIQNPKVSYTEQQDKTWEEKIGVQKWLAMYNRGFEGWTTYRILGFPQMNLPPNPNPKSKGVPSRFTYPIREQTLNSSGYTKAAQDIGGDELYTKIFWDK